MDGTGFNPASWSHWLLIGCFVALSAWGLMLSWRWRVSGWRASSWRLSKRNKQKWHGRLSAERSRAERMHRSTVESSEMYRQLNNKVYKLSSARDASRK